jgi:hypothetical protein
VKPRLFPRTRLTYRRSVARPVSIAMPPAMLGRAADAVG